ncbi:MAG: hypothetical protein UD961_02325 [Bacteroidales bacterium]|nr:hypothetical protein [Bacteroidales bacterium]
MRFLRHIITLTAFLLPFISSAQFFVTGDDPGRLKWYSIETDNFKVIYPEGTDSLARVYAEKIEKFRIPVSLTTGYISGQGDGRKMPVVMHAYNAANGSVAWAPKRMDLFTLPSAYDPEPMPWSTMLSVHESRHVTQMQFGMTRAQKPFTWVFGEMWNILVSLVYPGISNMEGDAVITETAWTSSGRGRTADFLNYYWVAFDNGDFRNWNRWRFVSQVNNAPNYYSLGYLTIGGFRYLYDCPEYMNAAYNLAASRPYSLLAFRRTAEKLTGKKFNDAFKEVCDTMYTLWKADADARKPYIPSEQVSADTRFYTEYKNNTIAGNDIYAIKKGHINTPVLVRIDSTGKETRISSFASDAGRMQWDPSSKRLYWSETSTDKRWNLQTKSRIRYIEEGSGRKRTVRNQALLYNPALSDSRISATRYQQNGKSFIEIIDSNTGKTIQSIQAPDSLQLLESVWIGEDIYATAISDNGYGIYRTSDWETILAPQPVKIKDFYVWNDELIFTCDRTGVNELYHLDPSTGNLTQKTSTRYGAEDFQYKGDWLYYSSQALDGKKIYRTPVDSLMNRSVNFSDIHHYHIAEAVTAQEKAIALEKEAETDKKVTVSDPQRYGKFRNAFNLHSWAPVYVNVDNIMNMSFDQIWQAASLGATGIFQNRLSTAVGEIGYSAHKDPYNPAKWRHSGHARFTYSGFYPIIEARVNFNDRAARQYNAYAYIFPDGKASMEVSSRELSTPYIEGILSTYIPFNFSSGGWYKGLIPKLTYRIGNDKFNTGLAVMKMEEQGILGQDGKYTSGYNPVFISHTAGKNTFRHSLTGSLRGYTMLGTASSAVYPKWGIGAEIGASGSLESSLYLSPMGYFYLYGYVPGILAEQGLKLTLMTQQKLRSDAVFGQPIVSVLPRGLSSNASLASWISIRNSNITKITLDYAVPIFIGDLSIGGPFFAIKRLVVSPHFDYSFIADKGLFSVGGNIILDMHSILRFGWPCSFGVTMSYNGGPAWNSIATDSGITLDRFHFGPTFNVSF